MIRAISFAALLFCHFVTWADNGAVPKGWWVVGDDLSRYVVQTDSSTALSGPSSALIAARGDGAGQFGGLGQAISAEPYRGQKLRYTGSLKTEAVNGYAGLWMRLDGEDGRLLSLDNMSDRPLSGTQDWARHEIVLDVPAEAGRIVFGAILSGAGRVWFDDARLEVADPASPVTAPKAGREVYNKPPVEALPEAPRNLRFDE